MKIGNIKTKTDIFLSPMAGVTDAGFRKLCRDFGAGLTYTEMVSVKALSHNSRKTQTLLTLAENEAPSAVQLFGHDPQAFERTIKSGIFDKFDIIDINMGCPAPKIVQNGDGSALLKNFDLARQIIETCVASTTKPITVKFRKGYGLDDNIAVEFAKMCESAGASAITVHPRTRDQFYSGKADYSVISDVVKAVSIPVIANGDVVDIKSYNEILKTGCAAVMIGRGALGKPEIFAKLLDKNIKVNKLAQIKEHLSLIKGTMREEPLVRSFRKHLLWYISGCKNSTELKRELMTYVKFDDVFAALEAFFKG